MKANCDYCNKEIETTKDQYSYFAELRAVYCKECSDEYQKRCKPKKENE